MTGRQWELARIILRPGERPPWYTTWAPPAPGLFVLGLCFSQPTELRQIHIAHRIVATNNRELVRQYPEYRVDLLDQAYTEWRPTKEPGYVLRVGEQFNVEIETVYASEGWVELLHEFVDERATRLHARETRRARQVAECLTTLKASIPPLPARK